MADRYPVSEVVQIGVEGTAGTNVTPTKQFGLMDISLDTEIEFDEFGAMGQIPNTSMAPRQEWATGSLSGLPSYTEIAYALSNLFGAATITTPSGATNAREWAWAPSASTPWAPKTWTVRRGVPSGTAEEAGYALLSGLKLELSRNSAQAISGDLFARRLDYAATMASTGITTPTQVPLLAGEIDIYLDSASGSLGSTKLTRDFFFSYEVSDLFGPIWPLNSSLNSFAAHGVQKPNLEAVLRLGNDTVGTSLVTNMRAGSSVFVRAKATSGTMIESSTPYSLTMDMALKVAASPKRGDEDGLLSTLEWTMRNVYDATWSKFLQITLVTDLTGL